MRLLFISEIVLLTWQLFNGLLSDEQLLINFTWPYCKLKSCNNMGTLDVTIMFL